MANKRDIKRRINSIKNTQKITKAMKLVSAAKFARASHAVNASRPYAQSFDLMVKRLCSSGIEIDYSKYPLLQPKPTPTKILLVILATDRGLCGSLNSAQFKAIRQWLNNPAKGHYQIELCAWGRKAIGFAKKLNRPIVDQRERILEKPHYELAVQLSRFLTETYLSDGYDAVYFSYNQFINALTQRPQIEQILPIGLEASPEDSSQGQESKKAVQNIDFITEPGVELMLDTLLKRKMASYVFQALLEGAASEHGSRMTAMDSATTNAEKVCKKLTLAYNRARQASITKELIEIISGAEAL